MWGIGELQRRRKRWKKEHKSKATRCKVDIVQCWWLTRGKPEPACIRGVLRDRIGDLALTFSNLARIKESNEVKTYCSLKTIEDFREMVLGKRGAIGRKERSGCTVLKDNGISAYQSTVSFLHVHRENKLRRKHFGSWKRTCAHLSKHFFFPSRSFTCFRVDFWSF